MRKRKRTPEICPVCDEDVPPKALSCPNCGACHESGWKDEDDEAAEEVDYSVLDLPVEVLDEDERKQVERLRARRGIKPFGRWVAVITLLALFWGFWKWLAWQFQDWVR